MMTLFSLNECQHLTQIGLALLVQSSLILLLGLTLKLFVRRQGPRAALLVYRATLTAVVVTGLAALTVAPYVHPLWHISLPNTAALMEDAAAPQPTATQPPPVWVMPPATAKIAAPHHTDIPQEIKQPVKQSAAQSSAPTGQWYAIIVMVWGLGSIGLCCWLVLGQIHIFRLRRTSKPFTGAVASGLLQRLCPEYSRYSLTLLTSPQVQSPFLAGVWRPAIFLPSSFEEDLSIEEQKMVLAHEIAHWRHRDNVWVLFTRLTCAALWWQPLPWLLGRRMSQASEEACDVAALTMGCPAQSYADCLLMLAERLLPTRLERSLGNGVVPFRSSLGQRIQTILRSPRQQPLPVWFRPVVVLAVAVGMVLGLRLISGADAPPTPTEVVRQYLADCAAGRLSQAYSLLSSRTQSYIAYTRFSQPYYAGTDPIRRYPPPYAIETLFREPRDPNIRFEVVGTDPKSPNTILVRAYQPGTPAHTEATIRVVTLVDPKSGSQKLDFVQTGQPVIPGLLQSLEASKEQKECASHMKEIGLSIINYIQDHDERFPHADRWMDEIMPYLKDAKLFHDPAAPPSQKYSYAFNSNLSGVSLSKVGSPAELVMIFDSSKGARNASDAGQSLPHPGRHVDGNDFVFTDGHQKWFRNAAQYRPSFTLQENSSASAQADSQIVGRFGITTIDNVPVHAGKNRFGRILCILPRGEQLAVTGKTDSDYTILMIDHTTGYIRKDAVQLLDNVEILADGSTRDTTSLGYRLVQAAEGYLGVPYRRGGSTRDGIGDAGLIRAVYASVNITLPRSDVGQAGVGYDVPHNVMASDWTQWVPGDRLYFAFRHPRIEHTSMYIGNGLFIHASVGHNNQVAIDRVDNAYYSTHLVAVRRSQELLNEPPMPGR